MTNDEQRLAELVGKKSLLTKLTGHELLEPGNQFCKRCNMPMFVGLYSTSKCVGEAQRKIK